MLDRKTKINWFKFWCTIGFWPAVFAIYVAWGLSGHSIFAASGMVVLFTAPFLALSLYRTLRFGRLMHVVPYLIILIGTFLISLGPDVRAPIGARLVLLAITVLVHGVVVYEMHADSSLSDR